MRTGCCVQGCVNAKPGSQVARFRAPRDSDRKRLWSEALRCEVGKYDMVCELHFRPGDVLTEHILGDGKGNILYRYEYERKRLSKTAVPFYDEKLCVEPPSKVRKLVYANEIIKIVKVETLKLENDTAHSSKAAPHSNAPDPSQLDEDASRANEEEDEEEEESGETCELYNEIVLNKGSIELPGEEWAIHQCTTTGTFVFSAMTATKSPEDESCIIPVYTKQVIVKNNAQSEVQLRFLHKSVGVDRVGAKPTSAKELEQFLQKVDDLGICSGRSKTKRGKAAVNSRRTVSSRTGSTIRHKRCPVVLTKDGVCEHCSKS